MRVLVSDTSVLVDLERGGLQKACFRLPFRFAVPDLLYERELELYGGEELVRLGLTVEDLDSAGVVRALTYRRRARGLSLPDCFALALAHTQSWILLSGDGALRRLAAQEAVECHGLLWLLDRMHDAAVVSSQELSDGLTAISRHPRCRLPKAEVRRRLTFHARHRRQSPGEE